ncbi:MAG: class I SAM-dependent methyltransferase [Luteolibacter sp.]
MSERAAWQGMWTVVRFNWPFYAFVFICLGISVWGFFCFAGSLKWLCLVSGIGSSHFLAGSLFVSHWVYDRSDLYRWKWLERALDGSPHQRVIFCHSGFDETSTSLRERFPDSEWLLLDHYDEALMSEASIRRARSVYPPSEDTVAARFDRWPVSSQSADVVLGLLAIHELRDERERILWFSEAKRCLRKEGRVILAEHIRDTANFLAFGPGFLHFHSWRSWESSWEGAGLCLHDTFRVTPWIRIIVLRTYD